VSDDGLVFDHPNGQTFPVGTLVAATATELTVGPDAGCPNQTTPGPGHYSWTLAKGTLTFKELDPPDTCRDRAATLTTVPWTLGS
jgi:hypothetical protein